MVTLFAICICTAVLACVILQAAGILAIGVKMNLTSQTPRIELLLHSHELLSLDNRKNQVAIECKNGIVWITCPGGGPDHILEAGARYVPKTKGAIVIEAIGESCVDIVESNN